MYGFKSALIYCALHVTPGVCALLPETGGPRSIEHFPPQRPHAGTLFDGQFGSVEKFLVQRRTAHGISPIIRAPSLRVERGYRASRCGYHARPYTTPKL